MNLPEFFEAVNTSVRESESTLVSILAAIGPWAAPLAPAVMSYQHMVQSLLFPWWVALSIAFVIEIQGLTSVSTYLSFWAHNRRYKDEKKKTPTGVVVVAFMFYLAVVLAINVLLDASQVPGFPLGYEWVVVIVRALLTLLSIPAALILAVRALHKDILDEMKETKKQNRENRIAARYSPTRPPVSAESSGKRMRNKFMSDYHSGKLQALLSERGLPMNADTISELYGVDKRSYYRWMNDLRGNGDGKDNG